MILAPFTISADISSAYGLYIGNGSGLDFTNSSLAALNLSGSGKTKISYLTVNGATALIGNIKSDSLTSLTLNGNIKLGGNQSSEFGVQISKIGSLSILGATDNASVWVALPGAPSNQTQTITLGNGNNKVVDQTLAGTVNVTLGTGANYVEVGSTQNTTGVFNITLGGGTDASTIRVGNVGNAFAVAANYTITGAQAGDLIYFARDTGGGHGVVATSNATTMNLLLQALDALPVNSVVTAQIGGNTYLANSATDTLTASETSVIMLTGVHTFTAGSSAITVTS